MMMGKLPRRGPPPDVNPSEYGCDCGAQKRSEVAELGPGGLTSEVAERCMRRGEWGSIGTGA